MKRENGWAIRLGRFVAPITRKLFAFSNKLSLLERVVFGLSLSACFAILITVAGANLESYKLKRQGIEAEKASRKQMEANFQGRSHDAFICRADASGAPSPSFDDGKFWWSDDGRCATVLRKQKEDADAASRAREAAAQASWTKAKANFQGRAHDEFLCNTYRNREQIITFDGGKFWWSDEGLCAKSPKKERDEEEQAAEAKMDEKEQVARAMRDREEQVAQAKKDEDAQISSYLPTTVRVNTDMDSFWLPDEERTCVTIPDQSGKVESVICDSTTRANHNIPVKFWGGVERGAISHWKCRREKDLFSDKFVCRSVD